MFSGGTGPADGTNSATTSPGKYHIHRMLEAMDNEPVNFGLLAKVLVLTLKLSQNKLKLVPLVLKPTKTGVQPQLVLTIH